MPQTIDRSPIALSRRIATGLIIPALAAALAFGGLAADIAAAPRAAQGTGEECQADRSNHLFGGLLTGPLRFVDSLLPFTIAGEQYPVCDE